MSIDDRLRSSIVVIPSLTFVDTDKCSYLSRRIKPKIWMESSMNDDEILSLYDMRKREEPLSLRTQYFSKRFCFLIFDIDPILMLSCLNRKGIL